MGGSRDGRLVVYGLNVVLEECQDGVAFISCEGVGEVVQGFEELVYCGKKDLRICRTRVYTYYSILE